MITYTSLPTSDLMKYNNDKIKIITFIDIVFKRLTMLNLVVIGQDEVLDEYTKPPKYVHVYLVIQCYELLSDDLFPLKKP